MEWLNSYCPYHDNVTDTISYRLQKEILAQQNALDSLRSVFSSWEIDRKSGYFKPLVLAFTGPTGVGKTETAFEVAASVVKRHLKDDSVKGYKPCGLLEFRGEEFAPDSEALRNGPPEAQRQIRTAVVEHLRKHDGRGVIIFDEARKIAPGVLNVLASALDARGYISDQAVIGSNYKPRRYGTSHCIFIFIIDIDIERFASMMLVFGGRQLIPPNFIRNEIKGYLESELERLNLGKVVNEIIPFLPLEQSHLQQILNKKIQWLASTKRHEFWLDLVVDSNVQAFLVDPRFIHYKKMTNPTTKFSIATAHSGGRSLENAGPFRDLRAMMRDYMSSWRPGSILHVGMAHDSIILTQQRKVGFTAIATQQLSNFNAYGDNVGTMYMQWCKPNADLLKYIQSTRVNNRQCSGSSNTNSTSASASNTANDQCLAPSNLEWEHQSYFFSDNCEMKWYGRFINSGRIE